MRYEYGYTNSAVVADARADARATFIRRTYAHLAGAILAFVALEAVLLQVVPEQTILRLIGFSNYCWLAVMLLFMGANWVAQSWARSDTSPALQYAGLGLCVVAWAFVFIGPLYYAKTYCDSNTIPIAGILTLSVFGGLTLSVFVTRKDYSFLRPILSVGSMIALGVIVAACFFPIGLGLLFSFAMVALTSGYILYNTSNVLLYYRPEQYVAAALALFSSVAQMFWYILQIVSAVNRSR